MGSLDSTGHTLCNSNLRLEVTGPDREIALYQTNTNVGLDEGGPTTIKRSITCGDDNVTDHPDYYINFPAGAEGLYRMVLKNLDTGLQTSNMFYVHEDLQHSVTRQTATRINPFKSAYTVNLKITAKEDFYGRVEEFLPENFIVTRVEGAVIEKLTDPKLGKLQELIWQLDLEAGQEALLSYEYQAPKVSPEIFSIGYLQLRAKTLEQLMQNKPADNTGELMFSEVRAWQIASDATQYSAFTASTTGTNFVVPTWVDTITVKMWGAGGGGAGGGDNSAGGAGGGSGYTTAVLTVTPGETLSVLVGGAGGPGQSTGTADNGSGGGGGGYSAIKRSTNFLMFAGGGGGGGSGSDASETGGAGGAGGGVGGVDGSRGNNASCASGIGDNGDAASSTAGGGGSGCSTGTDGTAGSGNNGGLGGWGGAAGNASGTPGTNGGAAGGSTGTGTDSNPGGGGGGGGYLGGGGGEAGVSEGAGGGGGGSGFATSTNASATSTTAGSGTTPGNSGDSDRSTYCSTAGNGGTAGNGDDGAQTAGVNGCVIISWRVPVIYQGTVYQSEGGSNIGTGKTINLYNNGTTFLGSTTTNASGAYYLVATSSAIASGDLLTFYIDNDATYDGSTIFKTSAASTTGVDIYGSALVVNYDTGSSITNANLVTAIAGLGGEADMVYSTSTSNSITLTSGFELHVWTGQTYIPGGSITTQGAAGNFHMDDNASSTLNNSGTYIFSGDIVADTGTTLTINDNVTVNGGDITTAGTAIVKTTAGTPTVTISGTGNIGGGSATTTFYNLTTSGSGTTTLSTTTVINNDLSVGSGTVLTGTSTVIVAGGDATGSGTINMTAGIFEMRGTGQFGGSTAWTFNNLKIGNGATASTTALNTATVTVASVLTIGSTSELVAGPKSWVLSGSGTPLVKTGTFTASTSLFSYSAASATQNIATTTFYNLVIGSTTTGVAPAATTLTVNGNFTNNGTFTHNSGTVTLSGTSQTITGATTFNNLTTSCSGTVTAAITFTVAGTLTNNTPCTLDMTSATLTLSKAGTGGSRPFINTGTFTATSSTIKYTADASTDIELGTYNNLEIDTTVDTVAYTQFLLRGTTTVAGVLTIGNASSTNFDDFRANGFTLTFSGSGDPLVVTTKGELTSDTGSTVIYSGTSATNIQYGNFSTLNITYWHLSLLPASGSPTYTVTSNGLLIPGNFVLGDGINAVTLNSNNLTSTFRGTVTFNANSTYTKSNNNFNFQAGDPGQTFIDNTSGLQDLGNAFILDNGASSTTLTLGSNMKATTLNLYNDIQTFNGGPYTVTLLGTGTPLSIFAGSTFNVASSTINYTGSGATVTCTGASYGNLGLLPASTTAQTICTAASQTLNVTGNLTIGDGTNAGATAATRNPTINIGGDMTIAANATYTKGTGTTTFQKGGSQTLTDNTSGQDLGIVKVSASTTNTTLLLAGSPRVTTLTVDSSQTLNAATATLTILGTSSPVTMNGTFTASTSTVSFKGTTGTTSIPSLTYYNLDFSPASGNPEYRLATTTLTVNNNLTTGGAGNALVSAKASNTPISISGSLTIASGDTFSAATSATTTLVGNLTNAGTFTHNSGLIVFSPTATSTITSSSSMAFYNLSITSAAKELRFMASSTVVFTIAGTFVASGSPNNLIILQSDTSGSQWIVHFNSAQSSMTYVYVKDSGCDAGTSNASLTDGSSTNGSNNGSCWVFVTVSVVSSGGGGGAAGTPGTEQGSGGGTLQTGGGQGGGGGSTEGGSGGGESQGGGNQGGGGGGASP